MHGASETTSSLPFLNAAWHDANQRFLPRCHVTGDAERGSGRRQRHARTHVHGRRWQGTHPARPPSGVGFEDNTASRRALVAFYQDEVQSPVIGGGGSVSSRISPEGTFVHPVSQGFRVTGPGYTTGGVSAVLAQKIVGSTWATLSMRMANPGLGISRVAVTVDEAVEGLIQRRTEAVTASLDGRVTRTGTGWPASYRWQPANTVTPVAVYDSFGQGAFLNILIRQRIHCGHLLPNGTEALVDVKIFVGGGIPALPHPRWQHTLFRAKRAVDSGRSFSRFKLGNISVLSPTFLSRARI